MKMVMVIVSRDQAESVLSNLVSAGYAATYTESRGGMLRQAQKLLYVGVAADKVDDVLGIIQRTCHSLIRLEAGGEQGTCADAELGYAVAFVWDLDRMEMY